MNCSAIEACSKDLFSDIEQLQSKYPKDTVSKIIRVRDIYLTMLKSPSLADSAIVRTFTARYRVSRPTAYSDLAVVKALLPSLGKEAREFHRWRVKEMLLETYKIASSKMDVRTMERVAATYAKAFGVAKEEEQAVPVEQILVQPWVPTDNPEVIGLKRLPDREKKIRSLLQELRVKEPEIIDIDFEEADIDPLSESSFNID